MNKEEKYYGEYLVTVWKVPGGFYRSVPWRFSIKEPNGKEWQYIGIPNYCTSKLSALRRAWYRVKWMREGTVNQHYV